MTIERRMICDGCHKPFNDFNDGLLMASMDGPLHKTSIDLCEDCRTKFHNMIMADTKNHNRGK